MTADDMLKRTLSILPGANPRALAARAGATCDDGEIRLPFLQQVLTVSFPDGLVRDHRGRDVPPSLRLIVLHYLLGAKGVPLDGMWVAYRQFPGANPFGNPFPDLEVLAAHYGQDREGFTDACLAMGGTPMDRTGDVAFRFLVFPKIAVALMLYLADEEFPASLNLVFDARCHLHLALDDLKAVTDYLLVMLRLRAGSSPAS